MNEPAGIKRALNAAWEQIPNILVAVVTASVIFIGSLGLSTRDLSHDVTELRANQQPVAFCERLRACPVFSQLGTTVGDCQYGISRAETALEVHERTDQQWQQRVVRLEQQVYDLLAAGMGGMSGKLGSPSRMGP